MYVHNACSMNAFLYVFIYADIVLYRISLYILSASLCMTLLKAIAQCDKRRERKQDLRWEKYDESLPARRSSWLEEEVYSGLSNSSLDARDEKVKSISGSERTLLNGRDWVTNAIIKILCSKTRGNWDFSTKMITLNWVRAEWRSQWSCPNINVEMQENWRRLSI